MGRLTVGPALGKKKKRQRVEEGLHQERGWFRKVFMRLSKLADQGGAR